jgi:hypothetical protein
MRRISNVALDRPNLFADPKEKGLQRASISESVLIFGEIGQERCQDGTVVRKPEKWF